MPQYGLDLALYNFLPVLFTALALFCIVRLAHALAPANEPMALLGAALVVLAGLCKALWKLILALALWRAQREPRHRRARPGSCPWR